MFFSNAPTLLSGFDAKKAAMNALKLKNEAGEVGYEDIYCAAPYIDTDLDEERYLIHMLYVPPIMRAKGIGKTLFKEFLATIPTNIRYIRLKACALGSGDTLAFWASFGFTPAYDCTYSENTRILHFAVNGFPLPPMEKVNNQEERHYIFD